MVDNPIDCVRRWRKLGQATLATKVTKLQGKGEIMQFLVITKPASPPPPEMLVPMIGAMEAWVAQHRASGKIKAVWAFAGTNGGGGVLEVESHEELDAIMARFPFAPFSSIEIIALSDLGQSLANGRAFVQEMMAGMAKP
jgi:muconolactone delta-isomerase